MRGLEGVTVTGSATVETVPDIVLAALGVDVRAEELSSALRTAEESLARMREAFVDGGVERPDIRTSRSTIWREDRTDGDGADRTVMHVRLGLQVTLRDVSGSGDLVHAALTAAGADASMDSLDFAVSDSTAATTQAREAAFDDARTIASGYAARAGRTLGRVVSIVEGAGGDAHPPMPRMAFAASSMPIEPGQTSVAAAVTVAWAFED